MEILAIDPGENTGWAWMLDGTITAIEQTKGFDDFFKQLEAISQTPPDLIVLENFRIRPKANFSWGEMPPIQLIGAVKYFCWLNDIELHLQEPSVKGLVGVRSKKSSKQNHAMDAAAHALFWWRKNGNKEGSGDS